ncbi:cytochrome [Streptomyces sp. Ru73]|uniref:cytochrome P450 n=1 Tax=Streptomyces sp. Ru73 TaxID=2080748 RepID=UPI000CDDC5DC|nr:cytochrome P450 [Streptomyces sp. Ru73]POX39262.1 cytochrome [Streptomyces sp. Ru73]
MTTPHEYGALPPENPAAGPGALPPQAPAHAPGTRPPRPAAAPDAASPPPGCPAHEGGTGAPFPPGSHAAPYDPTQDVVRLYGPDFAADPHGIYQVLRRQGPVAQVEIAPGVTAMLVTDYRAALELLQDDATWSKDSRPWMPTVPADSPVMPMLAWRPNVFFSDGEAHDRYRQVITDSFALIEPHELRTYVHGAADRLISRFGAEGRVDLISQYARVLPLMIFNRVFGLPDSYSDRLISALADMLEGATPEQAAKANENFTGYIMELVAAKKERRGPDLTSWFMDHPAGLSDEELIHQIVITMGAGHEPTTNLIGNALARMLSDDRYYSTLSGGALTARDAINDVLWNDPPLGNYSAHFPRRDVFFHGTWIRAGQLTMVSYAAANAQFGTTPLEQPRAGGGAHLSWAAGPHACPVRNTALLIATTAIERLTAWLSDIELTVPFEQLEWRVGAFHRALAALPARFTPLTPDQAGATPWDSSPSPSTRPAPTSPARPPASAR